MFHSSHSLVIHPLMVLPHDMGPFTQWPLTPPLSHPNVDGPGILGPLNKPVQILWILCGTLTNLTHPVITPLPLSQWPPTDNYCSGISWWLLSGGTVPPLATPSDINESFLLTGNHVVGFMANWPASLNTTLWSINTHHVDSSGAPQF